MQSGTGNDSEACDPATAIYEVVDRAVELAVGSVLEQETVVRIVGLDGWRTVALAVDQAIGLIVREAVNEALHT